MSFTDQSLQVIWLLGARYRGPRGNPEVPAFHSTCWTGVRTGPCPEGPSG